MVDKHEGLCYCPLSIAWRGHVGGNAPAAFVPNLSRQIAQGGEPMSTTPQNDSVGSSNSNGSSNGSSDEPKVIIDPAVLAGDDGKDTGKVNPTEPMPATDAATVAAASTGDATSAAGPTADPAATLPAANASKV